MCALNVYQIGTAIISCFMWHFFIDFTRYLDVFSLIEFEAWDQTGNYPGAEYINYDFLTTCHEQ